MRAIPSVDYTSVMLDQQPMPCCTAMLRSTTCVLCVPQQNAYSAWLIVGDGFGHR